MDLAIFVILPFLAVIPIYLLRRIRLLAVGLSLGVLAAQAGALQNIPLDRQAEFLNIAIVLDVPTRALLLLTLAVSAFLLLVAWRTATDELLPAVVPALIALAGLALMAQDTMVAGTLLILYALGALVLVPRGAPDGSAPALKPLVIIAPAFVCFVLAAGWEQTYQLNPDFTYLQERMAIVWALAFAAIMAVIPFHLVVPSLGQGRITGLVYALFLVDGIALIQMLRLLGSRPWLPELTMPWLTTAGVLMVLIGGVLAVGQNRLGRIVAYAVVADLGWLLVGVGTATSLGLTGAVLHVGSRILVLALLGGVVAIVRRHVPDDRLDDLHGLARVMPWTTGALVVGVLALAGLPPTLTFVSRLLVLEAALQHDPALVAGLLVGMAGVVVAGVRVIGALLTGPRRAVTAARGEPGAVWVLALALTLLALGVYPNPLLDTAYSIAQRLAFFNG